MSHKPDNEKCNYDPTKPSGSQLCNEIYNYCICKPTAEAEVKQGIINGLVVENAQLRERREDQKVLIHSLIEDNTLLTSENKRLRAMLTNAMDTEWLEDSGDE